MAATAAKTHRGRCAVCGELFEWEGWYPDNHCDLNGGCGRSFCSDDCEDKHRRALPIMGEYGLLLHPGLTDFAADLVTFASDTD